jgi:hypothetical protein
MGRDSTDAFEKWGLAREPLVLRRERGFGMCPAKDVHRLEISDDHDAQVLERHRERRISEIRARAPLPLRGFIPLERLKELAGERTDEGGAL